MKRTILFLTVVSLLVAGIALAKDKGDLDPPVWADPPVIFDDGTITLDWDDVDYAEKYSLDFVVVAVVDYWVDDVLMEDVEVEAALSFGTSDWNEDMSQSQITLPEEELSEDAAIAAIVAELGIVVDDLEDLGWVEVYFKVKGLDPHRETGKKNQDNPFSDPLYLL
jgi:hypothetical protein